MKIVKLKDFYNLPEGTLYSEYQPILFEGLKIKQDTIFDEEIPIDWFYTNLIGNIDNDGSIDFYNKCDVAENQGVSIDLNFDSSGRDGLFEDDRLFAVYEQADIAGFIKKLEELKKPD